LEGNGNQGLFSSESSGTDIPDVVF
jgi:hypothetical protein